MKHVYTAYRARSMCPVCGSEEEVFITNNGIFPTSTKTCQNWLFLYGVMNLRTNLNLM